MCDRIGWSSFILITLTHLYRPTMWSVSKRIKDTSVRVDMPPSISHCTEKMKHKSILLLKLGKFCLLLLNIQRATEFCHRLTLSVEETYMTCTYQMHRYIYPILNVDSIILYIVHQCPSCWLICTHATQCCSYSYCIDHTIIMRKHSAYHVTQGFDPSLACLLIPDSSSK